MVIQVELHTYLQKPTGAGPACCFEIDLPDGSVLADLLLRLEITTAPEHLLLVVNRQIVEPDHVLQDGDKVDLIPAMSGG